MSRVEEKNLKVNLTFEAGLAEFFMIIGDGEQCLEDSRQVLSEILEYNPKTLFNRFNRDSNETIKAEEIINFCADNGLKDVGIDEAQLLCDFFDDDGTRVLNYEEISHIFLPCEDSEIRAEVVRRNYYEHDINKGEFLNDDVEHAATRVFSNEFKLIRSLVKKVRELCWWNLLELHWFDLIDVNQ